MPRDKQFQDRMEFYPCSCTTHALSITPDPEWDSVYVGFWCNNPHPNGPRERIRRAWRALRGHVDGDDVVLNPYQAERLARSLLDFVQEAEDG